MSAACPAAEWHLATMGTRPDRRRRGLGSPMLGRWDEWSQSARLKTSSADNVRLYERPGFEIVVELELPEGAPTTWVMHRRPTVAV
jgi:GNAT superfamily N-acetyltransferase